MGHGGTDFRHYHTNHIDNLDHIFTPTLYSLHWLPVSARINYEILLLTHKCITGHICRNSSHAKHLSAPSGHLTASSFMFLQPELSALRHQGFGPASQWSWEKLRTWTLLKSNWKPTFLRKFIIVDAVWHF